jgi:hypothetical protein
LLFQAKEIINLSSISLSCESLFHISLIPSKPLEKVCAGKIVNAGFIVDELERHF